MTVIDPALFGMPDATTTGVRAGVTLTPYVGGTTITSPGIVIEGKTFEETLHIHAANVTVRDCFFENWSFFGIDADDPAVTGLLVEYCTFVPGPYQTNSAILGCGILRFNDISQSENGISVTGTDTSTITDNFIHDLGGRPDAHIDGIAIQGGQDGVLVEHNTVESWDTSCIFIQDFFAAINNVTVRNNLLYNDSDRGMTAAAIYVEGRFGNGTTNVLIENNYIMAGVAGYYSIDTASPVIQNNIEWRDGIDPIPYPSSPDLLPNAVGDTITTTYNTPITINVLANDVLGDTPTTIMSYDNVTSHGGTVALVGNNLVYTPAINWSGTDVFNYVIQDADGDVDGATVTVTVFPPPPPPPPPPTTGVTLIGTPRGDVLRGGGGDDTISGKGGHDWLYGQDGNDRITGGAGNDDLFGGTGGDTFVYGSISETPVGFGQRDLIHDFQPGVDKIDLSSINIKSGITKFTFLGLGQFSPIELSTPGLVKYHYETAGDGTDRTIIEGTVDSLAGVDFQISLIGHHVLSATDFIL